MELASCPCWTLHILVQRGETSHIGSPRLPRPLWTSTSVLLNALEPIHQYFYMANAAVIQQLFPSLRRLRAAVD